MSTNYEPWQLQRIRNGLQALRKLEPLEGGIKYTWKNLSKAIQEFTGVLVPEERLRKFVMGEPRKDLAEEDSENRHYPILSDERLIAVIQYLTHEDSDGYVFPPECLEIKPTSLTTALQLSEHFNGGQDFRGMSDLSCLRGLFVADQGGADVTGLCDATTLRFRNRHYQGLVPFVLTKKFRAIEKLSNISGLKSTQPSEAQAAVQKYEGWAIFTPEDSMFLMAQRVDVGENLLHVTLGLDKAIYLGKLVHALVLLEIDQPEDTTLVNPGYDAASPETLLDNVKTIFSDQLILFKRNDKFDLDIDI